ncbi:MULTISPECIES: hypothetical protein [Enterococcus]|nr:MULTISPECIES: hypothetical protein [Enterococcus]MCO5496067.1 hypothetical protein [Enterococcus innesii]OTO16204.1 hypothetical protein A5878_000777 [Enterococcus sp. 3G6_DIV0642]
MILWRNKDYCVLLVLGFILFQCKFPIHTELMSSEQLETLNRSIDAALSFASLATAFLFFTVSFIPVMAEKSPFFKSLRTDVKILERIMLDAFLFFLVSIMSLFFVFSDLLSWSDVTLVYSLWLTLLLTALYGMLSIFKELFSNIKKEINN